MCRLSDAVTHPKVPSWITQSRDEVAEAELEAASIHYTYMELIKKRDPYVVYEDANGKQVYPYGNYAWHEYWWRKHTEAAWFVSPAYTERRLGR